MVRRGLLILMVLIGIIGVTAAQSGGQFCMRAFEDRNSSGTLDAGEPLITRGISVNLLDAQNVTIASALLDQSPTAAQGVVCFQQRPAGQYTMTITSADYTATTPTTMTTALADGDLPIVMEFGGRRAAALATVAPTASASGTLDRDSVARIVISALGTLVVVTGMLVLGVLIYALVFRQRKQPIPDAMDPRRTTGSMSAVRARDTSEIPKV